jgi:hypothetical protein
MRKYNDELLMSVLNDKWNTEGIDAKVEIEAKPFFQLLTFRTTHKAKSLFDYNEVADEALKQLKEQINARLDGCEKISITPWGNYMLSAKFDGADYGRFWKDVYITIRLKIVFAPTPNKELYISDADLAVATRYLDPADEYIEIEAPRR